MLCVCDNWPLREQQPIREDFGLTIKPIRQRSEQRQPIRASAIDNWTPIPNNRLFWSVLTANLRTLSAPKSRTQLDTCWWFNIVSLLEVICIKVIRKILHRHRDVIFSIMSSLHHIEPEMTRDINLVETERGVQFPSSIFHNIWYNSCKKPNSKETPTTTKIQEIVKTWI